MKRTVAFVLCLLLVALAVTGCSSQNGGKTITVGSVTGAVGETVTVPITVSAGSEIAATDLIVYYDAEALSYVGYRDGDFSPDTKVGNLKEDGKFHYTLATLTPLQEEGTVFTLEFKILEGASGNVELKLEVPTLVNSDLEKLSAKIVNGTVTVQ